MKFHGGVHPFEGKDLSNAGKIQTMPIPERLVLSLSQGAGNAAKPIVAEGERVLKNQMLARADGWISATIHAPTSGVIEKIGLYAHAHPSGLAVPSIVLKSDFKDEIFQKNPRSTAENFENPHDFALFLQENGVIGMGGAGFPTNGKVKENLDEIIINAAECEPLATSDDLLMRERADDIVKGILLLAAHLKPKKVLIGIEDNKLDAESALQTAIATQNANIEIHRVPTLYPSGDAKHLAFLLTGKKIAASHRVTTQGLQVFNIATVYSLYRAFLGEPVISRIVTVTGEVANAGNFETMIGTPIEDLLKTAKIKESATGIIHGGPMMGFAVKNTAAGILKTTSCLIAANPALISPKAPEMPCIRCTECAKACPNELQPYALYWAARAKNLDAARDFNLFECMECGCCAFVCPANIPLVHYFRFAKSEIWAKDAEQKAAEIARERFEFKEARQLREKEEKAEKLKKLAAAKKSADAQKSAEKLSAKPAEKIADSDSSKPASDSDSQKSPSDSDSQKSVSDLDSQKSVSDSDSQKSASDSDSAKISDSDSQKNSSLTTEKSDSAKKIADSDSLKSAEKSTDSDFEKSPSDSDSLKIADSDSPKSPNDSDSQKKSESTTEKSDSADSLEIKKDSQ